MVILHTLLSCDSDCNFSLILDSNVLRRTEFPHAPCRPYCQCHPPTLLCRWGVRSFLFYSRLALQRVVSEQVPSAWIVRRRACGARLPRRRTSGSAHIWRLPTWSYSTWRHLSGRCSHRSGLILGTSWSSHWLTCRPWPAHRLAHRSRLARLHTGVAVGVEAGTGTSHWSWLHARAWTSHRSWLLHSGFENKRYAVTHRQLPTYPTGAPAMGAPTLAARSWR